MVGNAIECRSLGMKLGSIGINQRYENHEMNWARPFVSFLTSDVRNMTFCIFLPTWKLSGPGFPNSFACWYVTAWRSFWSCQSARSEESGVALGKVARVRLYQASVVGRSQLQIMSLSHSCHIHLKEMTQTVACRAVQGRTRRTEMCNL